jgi:hypothetical protein
MAGMLLLFGRAYHRMLGPARAIADRSTGSPPLWFTLMLRKTVIGLHVRGSIAKHDDLI